MARSETQPVKKPLGETNDGGQSPLDPKAKIGIASTVLPSFLEAPHGSWEDTAMPGNPEGIPQVLKEGTTLPHNENAECGWFMPPRGTLDDV